MPSLYAPQSLNRFSYVVNNPLRYVDPTGYSACGDPWSDPECLTKDDPLPPDPILLIVAAGGPEAALSLANVKTEERDGKWSGDNLFDAALAVVSTGLAFVNIGAGETWNEAFSNIFGPMVFVWGFTGFSGCGDVGGCTITNPIDGKHVIAFHIEGYTGMQFTTLVTHELGHTFATMYGATEAAALGSSWLPYSNFIFQGPESPPGSTYRHASSHKGPEIFADMFTSWVFNSWVIPYDLRVMRMVENARDDMTVKMNELIP